MTFSQLISAQEVYEVKESKVSIQTLKVECNSAKELSKIDWKDIQEIIENNEPNKMVALEFGVNQRSKSKETLKSSFNFKITGKSRDVLKIVERAQNGVKAIKKMSTKI